MPTAAITRPRAENSLCSCAIIGNDALHGAHHDAQKSTSSTLPVVAGKSVLPNDTRPADVRAGKTSPTFVSARVGTSAAQTIAKPTAIPRQTEVTVSEIGSPNAESG